jgi:Flp pilus assembly protein TadG
MNNSSSASAVKFRKFLPRSWLRWIACESGAIAPMFAGMIAFLAMLTAGGLEVSRWVVAQNEVQAALDAATLAAGVKLSKNKNDTAGAIAAAQAAYKANISKSTIGKGTMASASFNIQNGKVVGTVSGEIETIVGSVINLSKLRLNALSEVTIPSSAKKFEIAVMLDITGSMCDVAPDMDDTACLSGRKINAMKTAAGNLVNSVLATADLQTRVRMSVVPFSDAVRLPAAPRLLAAGPAPAVQVYTESYQECTGSGSKRKCTTKYNYYYYHPTECVAERINSNRYTDAAPGATNGFTMTALRRGKSMTDATAQEMVCSLDSAATVMPLSNDKTALLAKIQGLRGKGGTAGHLGTAWAWYTLSPNWKNVWTGTADDAAAYPVNAEDKSVKKIAVLMTDGEYNAQYAAGGYKNGTIAYASAANGASSTQALALCQGMKAKGIEVYTVGFEINSAAASLLATCATDAAHAKVAANGSELIQIFEDIAQSVMALYISK